MRRRRTPSLAAASAVAASLAASFVSGEALAVDLPVVAGAPVKVDITETSIFAQRFEAREGENPNDQGYFSWLNRLNVVLGWRHFTLGARIDTSLYALRPQDRTTSNPNVEEARLTDGSSRYRNSVYPAKLYLTYKGHGLEVTAGDSYVQFGRGLVLSMRKVDELGADTTLFGAKVTLNKDPFSVTVMAGIANPSRVDEPTGRALFPTSYVPPSGKFGAVPVQPLFGSDRLVGAQFIAGRGLPVMLSTHAVRLTKCAPYNYDAKGNIITDPFDAPLGTCDEPARSTWLDGLPPGTNPILAREETINAGQSLEVPSMWGHGNLYVEGAVQKRRAEPTNEADTEGNAVYASLATIAGPIVNTIEMKSYRNFYPLTGSVDLTKASAFATVAYSIPPTTEPIVADAMFNNFNLCVTGARDRFDYRFTPTFLAYAAFGYWVSRSEGVGGACDRLGRSTNPDKAETTNNVYDGTVGVEMRFDNDHSVLFANVNARDDVTDAGRAFYREVAAQYSLTKYITGPYAIELAGRHRYRIEDKANIRGGDYGGAPWWEGEHLTAFKITPKWIFSQGFEYKTYVGFPTYYINAGVLYKFTPQSNLRIHAGQNRGGLRCVSGICRVFPAFSGARMELTLRF